MYAWIQVSKLSLHYGASVAGRRVEIASLGADHVLSLSLLWRLPGHDGPESEWDCRVLGM